MEGFKKKEKEKELIIPEYFSIPFEFAKGEILKSLADAKIGPNLENNEDYESSIPKMLDLYDEFNDALKNIKSEDDRVDFLKERIFDNLKIKTFN